MRKESLFTVENMTGKRVYQIPAIKMVKLGTTTILAGSGDPQGETPGLTNDSGNYEF